jgi:actin related protein 2/3 complex subunit 1A/1B
MSVERLADTITCHAWNKTRDRVALCPNNEELHIYKYEGGKFTKEHVLKEHDQVISAIDWAPETNRIVTCSHDRNAYVWTLNGSAWEPVLVRARLRRAATHVRWSPKENKFAMASGARQVSVCYYEAEQNWWVDKYFKKHSSTVLCLAWHPSNMILATGCADGFVRLFATVIKGADTRAEKDAIFGSGGKWADQLSNFEVKRGWIHSIQFSPSGNQLAFTAHDSTVGILNYPGPSSLVGDAQTLTIPTPNLPYLAMMWAAEDKIVLGGYDCCPMLLAMVNGAWTLPRSLDDPDSRKSTGPKPGGLSQRASVFEQFENKVSKGAAEVTGTELNTLHQNAINEVRNFSGDMPVSKFSTSGNDGRIGIWDLRTLESQLAAMKM